MLTRSALLLLAAAALAGCSNNWEDASPNAHAVGAHRLGAILDGASTWSGARPMPASPDEVVEGQWHLVQDNVFADPIPVEAAKAAPEPVAPAAPPVVAPIVEPELIQRPAPTLPVPKRRVTPPPPKRGKPIKKTAKQLVREHYLDNPTTVRAGEITFYVPAVFLPEVRLKAESVQNPKGDRRVLSGGARLTCRELTLIAEQIIIRVRRGEGAELQITAMGNAELVSRVRDQAVRETGLRGLILRQDKMMPLR